jgi:hypothetical protein
VRAWQMTTLFAAVLACLGCGDGLVDVRARVTLDEKPVAGAAVTLYPAGGRSTGRVASGITSEDGSVRFTTVQPSDGVAPGEYKVVVVKTPSNIDEEFANADRNDPDVMLRLAQRNSGGNVPYTPSALPRIYLNPQQTPLELKVPPESEEVIFALDSSLGRSAQ